VTSQFSAETLVAETTAATKAAQASLFFMARPPVFWKVFAPHSALANET
jgi:hypothetical protein